MPKPSKADPTALGDVLQGQGHSDRTQHAINQWQSVAPVPGKGNNEFFRLAARLAAAGCSEADVHGLLIEQANFARHPSERIKEIPGIIASLRKKGAFASKLVIEPANNSEDSMLMFYAKAA
jgi:hypothetical protein